MINKLQLITRIIFAKQILLLHDNSLSVRLSVPKDVDGDALAYEWLKTATKQYKRSLDGLS